MEGTNCMHDSEGTVEGPRRAPVEECSCYHCKRNLCTRCFHCLLCVPQTCEHIVVRPVIIAQEALRAGPSHSGPSTVAPTVIVISDSDSEDDDDDDGQWLDVMEISSDPSSSEARTPAAAP